MDHALHLNHRQADEYHSIIHRYGKRIEKEARRPYKYWDDAAYKIYKLRMERDRKLQRVLSPSQFRTYVRLVREVAWTQKPKLLNYSLLVSVK